MKTHRSVDINLQHWRDFEFWLFTTMMSNYSIRCHQCFDIEFWSPNTKTIVASLIGSIPSFLTWMTVTALFLYRGPFSKFQAQLNETLYTIQKCFFSFFPAPSSSDFRISLSFLSLSPDATQLPRIAFPISTFAPSARARNIDCHEVLRTWNLIQKYSDRTCC